VTRYIGTGWKMNKTIAESRRFASELNAVTAWPPDVQAFIIPPFTVIATVRDQLDATTGVWIGAQNAHWLPSGAYTGEISMAMVKDAGANLVEIGHSERRLHFNETDTSVNLKLRAALDETLVPLVCVGEGTDEHEQGTAQDFVLRQVEAALRDTTPQERSKVLVAYEPIWSIGETGTPAEPHKVAVVVDAINREFGLRGVLYGGSVNRANARPLLDSAGVDGLFVGRAAWRASDFLELVSIVAAHGSETDNNDPDYTEDDRA
jgi:L-erythrulose 1-phosphate isomerase